MDETELFDVNGERVEGLMTKEQHEAALQTEIEKVKAEQENTEELDTAKKALDEANAKIAELEETSKGKNIVKLREKQEAAETAKNEAEEKVTAIIDAFKKDFDKKELVKNIETLARGDGELTEKILAKYEEIVKDGDDEATKSRKLGDAYRLVGGSDVEPDILQGVLSSRSAPAIPASENKPKFKQGFVDFAKNFGISEQDLTKYGKKR